MDKSLNNIKKIVLGTAQFGMEYGIANQNGQVHSSDIPTILDLAWENGINILDTAKAYGESEESIGNYLKQQPKRSWNIIAKLSDNRKKVIDQIQDSAEKLNTLPTIVMAHSAALFMDGKFQNELFNAKEKKIISKVGVSLYNENDINQVIKSTFKPEVIQLPLNILDTQLYQCGVLAKLSKNGIEIHARSAFLQGLFYLTDSEITNRFPDAVPFLDKLKSIANANNISLAELSLMWLLSLEEVSKIVIGVDNADQLKTHLGTLKKSIDPAIFKEALSVNYENEKVLNPSLW